MLVLLGVIVVVFGLDLFLPLEQLGLRPRRIDGLPGIAAMPFLHADLAHLCSNLVPLGVLLFMLLLSDDRPVATTLTVAVLGGLLTWLFARSGNHVGASGLVFGLAAYLVVRGLYARSFTAMVVAGVTVMLYGATLLGGIIPTGGRVSWDGHLMGLIAGAVVARYRPDRGRRAIG